MPRRPDLKRSKPQWAANISYAIPFDDSGANLWKYVEVISQEIHPGLGGGGGRASKVWDRTWGWDLPSLRQLAAVGCLLGTQTMGVSGCSEEGDQHCWKSYHWRNPIKFILLTTLFSICRRFPKKKPVSSHFLDTSVLRC